MERMSLQGTLLPHFPCASSRHFLYHWTSSDYQLRRSLDNCELWEVTGCTTSIFDLGIPTCLPNVGRSTRETPPESSTAFAVSFRHANNSNIIENLNIVTDSSSHWKFSGKHKKGRIIRFGIDKTLLGGQFALKLEEWSEVSLSRPYTTKHSRILAPLLWRCLSQLMLG